MEPLGVGKEPRDNEYVSEQSSHDEARDQMSINEKTLLWKIDLRILPIICVVYLMAFIDRYGPFAPSRAVLSFDMFRVNIGNAQLFSLASDLRINSNQYNIALAVFFVSYIVFEIPANILMKKVKPHIFSM
jgi:hypothetical protein